jgi:hypothetical protein
MTHADQQKRQQFRTREKTFHRISFHSCAAPLASSCGKYRRSESLPITNFSR